MSMDNSTFDKEDQDIDQEFIDLCKFANWKLGPVFREILLKLSHCDSSEDGIQCMLESLYDAQSALEAEHTSGEDSEEITPIINRKRRPGFSTESLNPVEQQFNLNVEITKSPEEAEQIREVVKSIFLLNKLDDAQMNVVIQKMEPRSAKKGDWIIRQGDVGNEFYIIANGQCQTFIDFEDGTTKMVKEYGRGDFFGELALMRNAPRAASIQAYSDTVELWALDRDTFRHVLAADSFQRRTNYEKFLSNVTLFQGLEDYDRARIVDALTELTFHEGEDIIRAGDSQDQSFYILCEGSAVALKRLKPSDRVETEVMRYTTGDYFGELALLERTARAATVRATSPICKVVSISRDAFERLLGPVHEILARTKDKYALAEKELINSTESELEATEIKGQDQNTENTENTKGTNDETRKD